MWIKMKNVSSFIEEVQLKKLVKLNTEEHALTAPIPFLVE